MLIEDDEEKSDGLDLEKVLEAYNCEMRLMSGGAELDVDTLDA